MKAFIINLVKKIIVRVVLNSFSNNKEVKKMFLKLKVFMQGKKSYFVIITGIISACVEFYFDFHIPAEVWLMLASLLGITLKAGQNRIEEETKQLLEAVKEANSKKK